MKTRLELQAKLEEVINSKNVWFKAPPNSKLQYPCIIYNYNNTKIFEANNNKYLKFRSYLITLITDDPDSVLVDAIENLPMCTWDRQFISGNKYHNVFSLYF